MLAPRHCNGCDKRWNGDTVTSRVRPVLELPLAVSGGERANRFGE